MSDGTVRIRTADGDEGVVGYHTAVDMITNHGATIIPATTGPLVGVDGPELAVDDRWDDDGGPAS